MPLFSALLLLGAALSAADRASLDTAVAQVFAPYRQPDATTAAWERPIYSKQVTDLIARWEQVMPEDEVDDLNDGDWLCQCQDWDPQKFSAKVISRKATGPDTAEVGVDIDVGFGEVRDAYFVFQREQGVWKVDDIYTEPHAEGIKDALAKTIAADVALAK